MLIQVAVRHILTNQDAAGRGVFDVQSQSAESFSPGLRNRQFAAAARKAHITQPALSNSIRTLEEHIGVQLFDRSERLVRVTSAGRDLLLRIASLLTEARNLEKEIGYLSQGLAGELRIGMTAHSAASIGGAILGNWLAQNGKVSADVTVADTLFLIDMLRKENLDLIIGDGATCQPGRRNLK